MKLFILTPVQCNRKMKRLPPIGKIITDKRYDISKLSIVSSLFNYRYAHIRQAQCKSVVKQFLRGIHVILLFGLISLFGCTNYSVSKSKTVPPILVSIANIVDSNNNKITGAYRIKVRVTNQEPFLAGYKLYVGNTENAARNPADLNSGLSCTTGPSVIPNQPLEYILDVATDVTQLPSASNRICTYQTSLTSGQYISFRTLLLSIQPSNQGGNRINPSLPSNTLVVP
ncbi:MAG TPA: hypothetical protein PK079_19370 [Leptospiraceae bacterium]|nr:hypothetical protein [Leptospiraceae bacterium]HMX34495.1 hypothetical protein [Leptospiraceae bacterium]HMY31132.1 hypothetical protein [Leptospiraceae bacterium]HMZ63715.1 hypothetical protein [Leptospiraceae bacterium]HNA09058.1 hypothetical protein [Leptospiraceae bacterium]